jgi:signal transduction histidine kinase
VPEDRALPGRTVRWAVLALATVTGVAVERASTGWAEARVWLPDLVVGLALAAAGSAAWPRRRDVAVLLGVTSGWWFLGTLAPWAVFVHVGVLIQLLVAYPGWRPASRAGTVVVLAGYAVTLAMPSWQSDAGVAVLAFALVTVLVRGFLTAPVGAARRQARVALLAGSALAADLVAGAVLRTVVADGRAVALTVLIHEVVVCTIAVVLVRGLRPAAVERVTDLVVELGESGSDSVRDALAGALSDPDLALGHRGPGGAWVDARGEPIAVPAPGAGRTATVIERNGRPFALLVHDAGALAEPALAAAVASATRLTASHGALHAEVDARLIELRAARRRLQRAADEEQARLERRLRDGAEQRLAAIDDLLTTAGAASLAAADRVAGARQELAHTLADLRDLAQGLRPRELDAGLAGALTELARRTPLQVELSVPPDRYTTEVETTAWFVCAEAVANATKHVDAAVVSITVARQDDVLVVRVSDDGVGGADPARGTGLRGLVDRVEALGGCVRLESSAGAGTRLAAELPLGRQSD